ncbi:hypothetical protein D9758_010975 [Tetrapyrgos nigripes]|uniref:Bromo domain-containing protein n=1 Tax=Tetrapyrgos nigripes TaxID=182062 RepID=A0A8H5LPF5_9AGAR|nr:hypothetical protein D9758_010975 [Tetrapyrgos nigripes]
MFFRVAARENCIWLVSLFKECWAAVYNLMIEQTVTVGKGRNQHDVQEPTRKCHAFLLLRHRNVWPTYYQVIKMPISMSNIRQIMSRGPEKGFASIEQYIDAWRLMFANAWEFNQENSQIYQDALDLEKYFDEQILQAAQKYFISLPESSFMMPM